MEAMNRNCILRFRLLSLVGDMSLALDVFLASPAGEDRTQSRLKPLPQFLLVTWERLCVQGRTNVAEDRMSESNQPRLSNNGYDFMGQQCIETVTSNRGFP